MTKWAYYNEHDAFAAAWIRELIKDGLVADGEVDERSIEDVSPADVRPFRQCHFFAGIGIWSLAARLVGIADDAPLWSGSCPCQPFSAAGKGGGFADERHLWPAFHYLIEQSAPVVIVGEQVAGVDGDAWLDLVSADMEATGYAFGAAETVACGFGAPHKRTRNYWVAHSANRHGRGRIGRAQTGVGQDGVGWWGSASGGSLGELAVADQPGPQGGTAERSTRPGGQGGTAERNRQAVRMDDAASARHVPTGCGQSGEVEAHERVGGGLSGMGRDGSGMANAVDNGLGQHGGRLDQEAGEGERGARKRERLRTDLADGGATRGMANADGRIGSDGDTQSSGQLGLLAQDGGARGPGGRGAQSGLARRVERPGPVNGFWRDADWLRCRDEKWRPVEPGTFPLVDAGAFRNRVGLLRGAGNAITIGQAAGWLQVVKASL